MRPPALRPNTSDTTHSPPQSPFVLMPRFGYEKSMKILYFPRIGNEESIKFILPRHNTIRHNQLTTTAPPQPPFVLLPRFGYEKSMKILYFPHIGNEESIKFYTFLVSNTRKVCHFLKCQEVYQYSKQVYQCSKSIPSTSIFLRSL